MPRETTDLAVRFRSRIETELAELSAASASTAGERGPVVLDQQSVGRLSRMDAMQQQAMAQEAERRRRARLIALKAALQRIDDGAFGECAECGEPIASGRLDIDPTVLVCVACARGEGR